MSRFLGVGLGCVVLAASSGTAFAQQVSLDDVVYEQDVQYSEIESLQSDAGRAREERSGIRARGDIARQERQRHTGDIDTLRADVGGSWVAQLRQKYGVRTLAHAVFVGLEGVEADVATNAASLIDTQRSLVATNATAMEALRLGGIARGNREVFVTNKTMSMSRISHLVPADSADEDFFVHLADVVVGLNDANEDNADAIVALDELMVAGDADLSAQLGHHRSLLDEFEQTMVRDMADSHEQIAQLQTTVAAHSELSAAGDADLAAQALRRKRLLDEFEQTMVRDMGENWEELARLGGIINGMNASQAAVRVFVETPDGPQVATIYPAQWSGSTGLPDGAYFAAFDTLNPLEPSGSGACFDVTSGDGETIFAYGDLPLFVCDGEGSGPDGFASIDPTELTMSQLTLHAAHAGHSAR